MPGLPKVGKSHEVARAAARILARRVPSAWTVSEPSEGNDYGVDLVLGIADGGEMTGRMANIQVKGLTTSPRGKARPRIRLKKSTIRYWQSLSDAAILIAISIDTERAWLCHAHDDSMTECLNTQGDSATLTLLPRHERQWTHLFSCIDKLSYRHWHLSHPASPVNILCPDDSFSAELESLMHEAMPSNIRFTTTDSAATQLSLGECDDKPAIIDLAIPTKHVHVTLPLSASELATELAFMLGSIGFRDLAGAVLVATMGHLTDAPANLRRACAAVACMCTTAEQTIIVRASIDTGRPWTPLLLGEIFSSQSAFNFTIADIDKAMALCALDTLDPESAFRIAQIYATLGSQHSARSAIAAAESRGFPRTLLERYSLAMTHELMGRLQDAEREYELARSAGFPSDTIQCDLFRLSLKLGDFSAAEERYPQRIPSEHVQWARATLCVVAYSFARNFTITEHSDYGGERVDAFATEELTDAVYSRMMRDGNPAKDKAHAAFGLAILQAVRTNRKDWFAAALVWGERGSVDEVVLQAIVEYASSLHGGDALRIAIAAMDGKARTKYADLKSLSDRHRSRVLVQYASSPRKRAARNGSR